MLLSLSRDEEGRTDDVVDFPSVLSASCCSLVTLSYSGNVLFKLQFAINTSVYASSERQSCVVFVVPSFFVCPSDYQLTLRWRPSDLELGDKNHFLFFFFPETLLVQSVKFQVSIRGILQKLTFGILGCSQPLSSKFPTGSWLFFWN